MSEDEFHFEFRPHDSPAPIEPFFDLGPALGHEFASDEVLLFSGGMDSLCGALVEATHQSSSKMARAKSISPRRSKSALQNGRS